MDIKTLNKWADLLFDTGKRNNLVNFRSTKTGAAEVLLPDVATLFHQAEHGAAFEVFDPRFADDDEDAVTIGKPENKLTREEYREAFGKKLRRGQVLVYNTENKPMGALRAIRKRGRTAIEENGVNILYLAFGFIHWREREDDAHVMRAPLLLVPISIESESHLTPVRIRVIDDEIIVNPTFSFKLQNEFGVKLPSFDEEEDFEAYFSRVELLTAKLGWSVSRACCVGVFSFLKLNMYQDLKANAATIITSKTVRAMMGEGTLDGGALAEEDADAALNSVVDADSSQTDAIKMAKAGKSFVLQGPPGTGKSQTITNIIAECLADGKRVLFVSEKLAALNVVFDKLKKTDLAEFCLELHSHKVNKKQVIEELCHTLRGGRSILSARAQHELDVKERTEQQLDLYVEELHRVRPVIGKSLYELYGASAAVRHAPTVPFSIINLRAKGEAFEVRATELLSQYAAYVPTVGADYRKNCWYGFEIEDTSFAATEALTADLRATRDLCRALLGTERTIKGRYGIALDTLTRTKRLCQFLALVSESGFLTPGLLEKEKLSRAIDAVGLIAPLAVEALEKREYLDARYDVEIYSLKGEALHKKLTRQFGGLASRLFSREYRGIIGELRLCRKNGKRPRYKDAVADTEALAVYQEKMSKFNRRSKSVAGLFGADYCGIDTDFARLLADLQALSLLLGEGVDVGELAKWPTEKYAAERAELGEFGHTLTALLAACEAAAARIGAQCDAKKCDLFEMSLLQLQEKLEGCLDTLDMLGEWSAFCKLMLEIEELGLVDLVDRACDRGIDKAELGNTFKQVFYLQWIDALLHDSPLLMSLSRVRHDEAVKQFKEKDSISFEINKARIRAEVCASRPSLDLVARGSAVSLLLREGEKRRKQKGVRQLLAEIGELVQTLKPCFLMSPLSVSTFLPSDMQFDVVVFDEASQIFPQDAVGAVYRGKQLIVVGDSKQMPPSNFFQSTADADEEIEDESISDFESILDFCATTLPQCRLKWHYRSRFEPLIAFSNKNFYDRELVTFPSVRGDSPDTGVDYEYAGGVFDRATKTNATEAARVVELVFEHIERYPERSLGVVAFSISQQTLIERLVAARRKTEPDKEFFFHSDRPEPFFVKNLETVQGDERDTIIFSVAYAADSTGRLLLNFGPINREGGERRLNVAVTRAKYNVKLVASMRGSDIDLSRTQSVGVRLLKEYLTYAENGTVIEEDAQGENAFLQERSECVREIQEFLRENGYETDLWIGASASKIDLALKHPDGHEYVLAIECDGSTYKSARSTRDRDRLRQSVLENMGWQYHRVWTVDWFRSKRAEKDRLLEAVRAAIGEAPTARSASATPTTTFSVTQQEEHFSFPTYEALDVCEVAKRCKGDLLRTVRAVLEVEAPLSEEWLLKRIAAIYGRDKVTAVVIREYESAMMSCERADILRKDGFLYLRNREIPMLRVPQNDGEIREIKYIAIGELAEGLREMLKQNVSAEKAGLFLLLAQSLGFTRVGDAMQERFDAALRTLAKDIEINDGMLSLIVHE